ncbi:hypothetical protein U0027_23985 (plasmid) [Agrobacterium tumefaciens]|uniref:hypothetical protein n=1 Tax=Agrobacterium tumefaciens TaxID=358 RepID=UPI00196319A2|nr:hypothetical protein [Agrobacterium tumefaciens]WQE43482.1 hypothetical protein U0027_23985 [Agrobacterium tumefaciens]
MTTLETRIYTYPPIPRADVSPLEMLILTNVLECSETDTGLVLFTDFGPTNPIRVARSELIDAFRASHNLPRSRSMSSSPAVSSPFCRPAETRSRRRR